MLFLNPRLPIANLARGLFSVSMLVATFSAQASPQQNYPWRAVAQKTPSQPNVTRPDVALRDGTRPGEARPGVARPSVARPAVAGQVEIRQQAIPRDSTVADSALAVELVSDLPTVPEPVLRYRLEKLQKTIPLTYNKTIHGFVDYFAFRKPSYTRSVMERMPLFFPLYERLLAKHGLPDELKFLSIVESSLNPRAVSRVGAVGLWQFMPGTGRDMRLYQDEYVDERMEPVKATEAACRYLKSLYNMFGDWELALAAYNSGPGTVRRAIRRSGGTTFWTCYNHLPKETRAYVPQFVALTYMMHYANDHGIFAERPEYPIPHDTIHVNGYFCLQTFARLTGSSLTDLQKLNPHIVSTTLPEYTRNFSLRVPLDRFDYFVSNRRTIMDSVSTVPGLTAHVLLADAESVQYGEQLVARNDHWLPAQTDIDELTAVTVYTPTADALAKQATTLQQDTEFADDVETAVLRKPKKQTHAVRRGETLLRIAERYDVEVYDLKKWNKLRSNRVQVGQKLLVLQEVAETRVERLAEQGSEKARQRAERTAKTTKRVKPRYHTVQQGDTLWNIAQRYNGLTIDRLKKLNRIQGNSLRPGQKLIVG